MTIQWKVIKQSPDYEISSNGEVRNKLYLNLIKIKHFEYADSKCRLKDVEYSIPELMITAFDISNSFNSKYLRHIDKNRHNNSLSNLKWSYIKPKEIEFYILFAQKDHSFRVINSKTGIIETLQVLPPKINKFRMLTYDGLKADDISLKKYLELFNKWTHELNNNDIIKIDYKKNFSDYEAVIYTFKRFAHDKYVNHDIISPVEYFWFEKCSNCGLQSLDKIDSTSQCWSYDFKNQYALALTSENKIPSKEGISLILDKLPKLSKNIDYGFYHVKITCQDPQFRKIFMYSRHDVYVDVSLRFAMKHRKRFNINIELVQDGKPNAYLYDINDMVTLKSICGEWFNKLTELRKLYPKNRLLKHLISSCWGSFSSSNVIRKTLDDLQKEKISFGCGDRYDFEILRLSGNDENEYYTLINRKNPYKHNIRFKPYVTSISRVMTAEIALQNLDKVVRIHTDCVSFTEEMNFNNENLVLEEKTTGLIHWKHVNRYKNMTTNYESKQYTDAEELQQEDDIVYEDIFSNF